MEVWKDIKGFEGIYQVSNTGKVKSLDRLLWCKDGSIRKYIGKLIRPQIGYGGYYSVQLRKNVTKKVFYVHRLVALTFCDGYQHGLQVNHINENKLDNHFENLEFVTKSENAKHSNISCRERSLGRSDVLEIRKRYKQGESLYSISKWFNQNSGTISNIVNGKTYKDVV